ncbi:cingulin-like protein 1 [Alosa pseudoharengus]|uniref:cingulin-like protein 1 n=1 Tax=Alosa pseudoharengus TaxID=34774 RepID=UPI003F8B0981
MESYRVGAAPGPTLQPAYPPQGPRGAKGQANGSYGLSIRVQGIDGHPYVVLNNQDRPSNPYPPSNGHRDPEGSFIDDYQEYDFRGPSPFVEFRSQNPAGAGTSGPPAMGLKENQDPQQAARRSPNLLNFQKHPELLKPYDPDSNTLEAFRSPPTRPQGAPLPDSAVPTAAHAGSSSLERPRTPAGQQVPKMPAPSQTYPRPYLSKSSTQGPAQSQNQAHPAVQSQVKPKAQPQAPAPAPAPVPAPAQPPQTKLTPAQRVPLPQAAPTSDPAPTAPAAAPLASRRSPSVASSGNSSLERVSGAGSVSTGSPGRAREPDVLPLRRVDSSGPVLQSSSSFAPRSRNSSTSSTATSSSATASRTLSPGRPPSDELEALYAESINRHKNRRYIPFLPGTGRDIDTGALPAVDALISHFDGTGTGTQRRGRTGRRGRIDPEDRKRSRSVDSALPFGLSGGGDYLEQVSRDRGRSGEHVLRPSQLGLKKGSGGCGVSPTLTLPAGRRTSARDPPRGSSAPGSPQGSLPRKEASALGFGRLETRSSGLPQEEGQAEAGSKVKTSIATTSLSRPNSRTSSSPKAKGPELEAQVTPDLLKGQQNVAQQTHEETAKQILFSYLKAGSNDNDDTTKRKVNLVFEKIQTLKSRAAGSAETTVPDQASQTKALEEQKAELEKQVSDLKARLEEETKKQQSLLAVQREAGECVKGLQQQLDQSLQESTQLREKLAKTETDLRTTLEELFQVKMEREQYQTEIRDLQDQLSEMHDELDGAKRAAADGADKEAILEDLVQLKLDLQEVVLAKDEQEEVLRRRERELTALKGALKDEVSTHDQEVDKLREQYEKEIRKLQTNVDEAKQPCSRVSPVFALLALVCAACGAISCS